MNNPMDTNKNYQEYVNQKSPNSPILKNCFNSFWVGGLICTIGQFIMEICKYNGWYMFHLEPNMHCILPTAC